jgi:hypothetical protein
MDALVFAALVAIAFSIWRAGSILERRRRDETLQRLLATFAAAAASTQHDPAQLLVWYPVAQFSRKLFPDAFREIDESTGRAFPFTKNQVQAAHARCSSDWLTWERAHDAEYSLKTAEIQNEIEHASGHATSLLRTRLAAVEQQKLERYQQRYEEYVRTAKALAALLES